MLDGKLSSLVEVPEGGKHQDREPLGFRKHGCRRRQMPMGGLANVACLGDILYVHWEQKLQENLELRSCDPRQGDHSPSGVGTIAQGQAELLNKVLGPDAERVLGNAKENILDLAHTLD
jgi:hypothetical protein